MQDKIIVKGQPIKKYSLAVIVIFCFLAISTTIRLAIEPKIVKLPAIVENRASACQWIKDVSGI